MRESLANLRYVAWGVGHGEIITQLVFTPDGETAVLVVTDGRGLPASRAARRAFRQRLHHRCAELGWQTPAVENWRR